MYLQKLELQGFKSFATKTNLEFLLPKDGGRGITAIVGPNGSGKSNIVDAIRWALGEQSMKMIRGKKGEDIIFSGSDKKIRSGFAEVSLYLNNEDKGTDNPYSEIVLTRRLYRNGEGEYLLNKGKVRLADINLLSAKSNIGSRSYSVIGQGMIDRILTLSDEERKDFFSEATGIKQYQIKKEQSLNKLSATKKNLEQVELVLREIEPHLRSLQKQAKKLEERKEIEIKLRDLEYKYYGSLWQEIQKNISGLSCELKKTEELWNIKKKEIELIQKEFEQLEKEGANSEKFLVLQNEYQKLLEEKNNLREEEWEIKNLIAEEESKNNQTTPLSLNQVTEEIGEINLKQKKIIKELYLYIKEKNAIEKIKKIISDFEKVEDKTSFLLKKMVSNDKKPDTKLSDLLKKMGTVRQASERFEQKISEARTEIQKLAEKESKEKNLFFDKQRKLDAKQNEIFSLENNLNNLKIDLARFETKRDSLEDEMKIEMGEKMIIVESSLNISAEEIKETLQNKDEIFRKIQRYKNHIELIGGIDPETPKEYKEINERYNFLYNESADLKNSIKTLEKIIKELNIITEKQFNSAFENINEYFNKYFKILFSGGYAKIIKVPKNNLCADENEEFADYEQFNDFVIEIHATPPGKKIKNLEVLSGGEKALTAIALLCAIMANNPSPFVVLDEVDAALDEANSIKFSGILHELSKKTQFVVITHNRATMERASILYGITMEGRSFSKLLSIKLENN